MQCLLNLSGDFCVGEGGEAAAAARAEHGGASKNSIFVPEHWTGLCNAGMWLISSLISLIAVGM